MTGLDATIARALAGDQSNAALKVADLIYEGTRRRHPVTPQPVHDCPLCHNNPGSDTAREQGCQCPVLDNEHGHTNRVVVNLGCPVHGLANRPEGDTL